ncbi:MAG: PstS family phosphate ABC transporter substrate-binding protein [Gammaproteobacteria bacterium]
MLNRSIRKSIAMTAVLGGLSSLSMTAIAVPTIKADGSSTVFPITEAVAEEFQKAKKGTVRVTVGISGTGGGFKKFCRGETDIQDASRPILAGEMESCKAAGIQYMELPVAYDALTVVVNSENSWVKSLTVAQLKKMWEPSAQGKISKWNQIDPSWPDAPIRLFGAGSDSGTFDYFTEAVVGKAKSSRGDYTASEDDNVLVQGVIRDKNALGYFGYAYYAENASKLKAVPISVRDGKAAVAPGPTAVINGSYQPLSRPIFIYVNAKSIQKPEVKEFVEFYLKNASNLVKQVSYIPLSATDYNLVLENANKRKLGSLFGGVPEVGVTIDELMRREGKL